MTIRQSSLLRLCVILTLVADVHSFSLASPNKPTSLLPHRTLLVSALHQNADASNDGEYNPEPELENININNNDGDDDTEIMATSTVRIDDGGSNLTERFKYKVNALMGVFDPPADTDNENETGNILNAMLTFPITYSFNCVGRTVGDDSVKDNFVSQVKAAVASCTGEADPDMICRITPRGNKFTKVVIEANVESAAMIAAIYKELEQLELSVMQF